MVRSAVITSLGMYVPKKMLTNEEIEQMLGRPGTADWLVENVGIKQRHIMAEDEVTSDLSFHAGRQALENAGLEAEELDLIILSTDTPDYLSPATSVVIQHKLGAKNAGTFDVNCACAGLVTSLDIASRYIRTEPEIESVLVIGAYGMTKFVDWTDHYTCTLFADAAGAMVLQASDDKEGFIASKLIADGTFHDHLGIFVGGTAEPPTVEAIQNRRHHLAFRKRFPADTNLQHWPILTRDCIAKANLSIDDIDWIFFTQVNLRTIEAVMNELGMPLEKTHNVMDKWGYTGSACIALAMYDAIDQGKLPPPGQGNGENIALCSSGGGFNMAAAVLKWW
ncbi:MAG: ketoacyl-ACP synthase III [Candidatus Thorarchaeota archaeon]|nr:MAG: ketoacyl-ACP synthase III [Candidatus Thorarchaeota archaeon]